MTFFKSPISYCGNKYKLLNSLEPLFPKGIYNLVDMFCGGLDISLNTESINTYSNDILFPLVDIYRYMYSHTKDEIKKFLDDKIEQGFGSSPDKYKELQKLYNETHNPLYLYMLCRCSFSGLIRFNSKKEFNTSFGVPLTESRLGKWDTMLEIIKRKNIIFSSLNFKDFDMSFLTDKDFVYCDPPYILTCGTYNDGKRGFEGWNESHETALYEKLAELDSRNIKFGISNVLYFKGEHNKILQEFIDRHKLYVHHLNYDYNGSLNTKYSYDKKVDEVFVCNYKADDVKTIKQDSLF